MASPHPHLHQPLLYLPNLPPTLSDADIAESLNECLPIRLNIQREHVDGYGLCSGTVEFKDFSKAEKALTTQPVPHVILSSFPPPHSSAPLPSSTDSLPRVVSGFPDNISTPGQVWEILRPVSLREIRFVEREWGSMEPPQAIVEFWYEDDARKMEVDPPRLASGRVFSVVPYNPHRRQASLSHHQQQQLQFQDQDARDPYEQQYQQQSSAFSVDAPAFVPGGAGGEGTGDYDGLGHSSERPRPSAPPRSSSQSASSQLIDPCNLFVKNVDLSINSNDLFFHFRRFGRIVSARIMRDEKSGASKGFGFVSYQKPEEARAAIEAMDNTLLGNKVVTVRLHEPKRLRTEKLAEQRRVSGASIRGGGDADSYERRTSGGEPSMPDTIDAMSSLGLGATSTASSGTPSERNSSSTYPSPSAHLSVLPSTSTPDKPSDPFSATSTSTSPSSISPSSLSEKDRLLAAISPLLSPSNPQLAQRVTEMILTLKKRDRALCLFNSDFLREKVIEASEVLEALGDEDESEEDGKKEGREYPSPGRKASESFRRIVSSSSGGTDAPETPTKKPFSSTSADLPSPISPAHLAASKSIIAAPASPSSATARSTTESLKDLAPLPIIDILAYLRANDGLVPGIDKADEAKKREMDAFLKRISPEPIAKQKQQLGERVFKLLKTFDLPRTIRTPKVTVHLLDNEDFPSLGHLAAEYPLALKARVLAAGATNGQTASA